MPTREGGIFNIDDCALERRLEAVGQYWRSTVELSPDQTRLLYCHFSLPILSLFLFAFLIIMLMRLHCSII